MPTYCYRVETTDEVIEITMPYDEMKHREVDGVIELEDGTKARRDYSTEHGRFRDTPGNWQKFESLAMGVNPSQIPERMRMDEEAVHHFGKHARPDGYTPGGDPIFTSKIQRDTYARANGFYVPNSYVNEPTPAISHEQSFNNALEELGDVGI